MLSVRRILADARSQTVVFGVAMLVTPLCGWVFGCGCDWPWHGLAARCDYFDPAAAYHCPWCEHAPLSAVAILLATATGVAVAHRAIPGSKPRGTVAIAALSGLAVALAGLLFIGVLTLGFTR